MDAARTEAEPHRKSWPGPSVDENTPLLLGDTQSKGAVTSAHHQSIQVGEAASTLRNRRPSRAVGDGEEDVFDINELVRHRSRLSSNVSVLESEEARNALRKHDLEQAREDVARLRIDSTNGEGLDQIHEEGWNSQDQTNGAESKQGEPDSKFVGVSPLRFWVVFSTILLGYFVACFDTTLMASSHPVITSYFNASKEASWLTTVFMITNTGFQPLFGRLSDTVGRKSCYLFVVFVFAITNLWCALANSIGSFIAARAVCGLGAGATMSVGLIILNDLVRVEYRGVYIAHVNLAFGLGSTCGAAFGGVLCDSIGWRWAFGIQVPTVAVCFIAALFTVPKNLGPMLINERAVKSDESDDGEEETENAAWRAVKNFDSLGVAVLLVAITLLIVAINTGGNLFPWSHPLVIVCLVLAVVLSVVFVFVERRAKQPVMPLRFLVRAPIANMVFANLLAGIASNTVLFNVPLWFQAVKLSTPTASGLRLASPSIGGSIAGILSGYIITWTRRLKPTVLFGAIVYLAGSIALLFIKPDNNEVESITIITWVPTAQGFVYPSTMMSAFALCATDEQAVATTTISLWRNLGIVLGVAISSLVFQNMLKVNLEDKVMGPDKAWIIDRARSSVGSIKHMAQPYQQQVIDSYAAALKLSFVTALVASVIMFLILAFVKLPRLGKGKKIEVGPGE